MIAILMMLFGCVGATVPECLDNGNCDIGQACIEEECQDVDCMASIDCAFGNYCDIENDLYACSPGCAGDDDCAAGESCNLDTNECEEYGCRDSDLDCAFGELCEESDGECYVPDGEWCSPCDDPFSGDPRTCGDGYCFNFNANGNYDRDNFCLPQCNGEGDTCARGYECFDVSGFGEWYCVTDCTQIP